MITRRNLKAGAALAALLAATGAYSAALSNTEYDAAKQRVSERQRLDTAACARLAGNGRDVCRKQSEGNALVARAELEHSYSRRSSDANKVVIAKANATLWVAAQLCDERIGSSRVLCLAEARAAYDKAMAGTRMSEEVYAAK